MLDDLPIEPGSIYVMDRGYLDFTRLARFTQAGAFFVIRAKSNLHSYVSCNRPVDRTTGLRCDQSIRLRGFYPRQGYPNLLRRIRYVDAAHEHSLIFLTNHFSLPAFKITEIYKSRWQIELFFRWIKQHLRIRSFIGASDNAVRIQIWATLARDVRSGRKPDKFPCGGMFNDVDVVAAYAPFCDAMFVDKEISHLAHQGELRRELNGSATLFSLRADEDRQFLAFLDQIEADASSEHLKLVAEVYGTNWEKPYLELLAHS